MSKMNFVEKKHEHMGIKQQLGVVLNVHKFQPPLSLMKNPKYLWKKKKKKVPPPHVILHGVLLHLLFFA